jgi:ATP-binding cassette subfamily F protein uup
VTLGFDGGGKVGVYAGGWTDYLSQRGAAPEPPAASPKRAKSAPTGRLQTARGARLSFAQAHRLEQLPGEIGRLSSEIAKLEELLADAGLYARDHGRFAKASEALAARQAALQAAEEEWLTLEGLREAAEG